MIREGARLDMSSTYPNKATLYGYCLLLPFFTAAGNVDDVCLGQRDKARFTLAFKEAVKHPGDIEEPLPLTMGNDMRQRITLFRLHF